MEQNASSHGFRTCPYLAPRRRQHPIAANGARLEGVPPIAGLAAPAHLLNFFHYSGRTSPKTARHAAARLVRCATGANGSHPGSHRIEDLRVVMRQPSIRTTQATVMLQSFVVE